MSLCLYAYAYALVETGLKKGLIRQANKTSVRSMANNKQIRPHDAGCLPFSVANLDALGFRT